MLWGLNLSVLIEAHWQMDSSNNLYWNFKWTTEILFKKVVFICSGLNYVVTRLYISTLRLSQNGRHATVDIVKFIFLYENSCILIWIALKCVPKGPINNKPSLVQVMAWHQWGDKSLPEAMMA